MLRIITAIMLILNIAVFSSNPDSLCLVPTAQELNNSTVAYSTPLSGNLNVVFIEFTFPDYGSTMREYNSTTEYTILGTYPDGSSIQDDIDNNGNIKAAWLLKDATIDYFETMSHGNVNVNFEVLRNSNRADSMWRSDGNYSNYSIHNRQEEVLRKVYVEFPTIIDNAGVIVFYSKNYKFNLSSIYSVTGNFKLADGTTIFNGPYTYGNFGDSHRLAVITHEIAHRIEYAIDRSKPTLTFPDRGTDRKAYIYTSSSNKTAVYNLTPPYDLMYHNDPSNSHLALYGQRPLNSYDLIRLGWIASDEILEIDSDHIDILKNIRIYDMRKELTSQQRDDGNSERGYRIIKVYLNKDYYSTHDEYYLIEYHKGTDYDREFSNYDESPAVGILIWHIADGGKSLYNNTHDPLNPGIDLLCAVPYNGFNHDPSTGFGAPLPNDAYPKTWTTYSYGSNFTGIQKNDEYDWLNDLVLNVPRDVVNGWGDPTNGGRQLYELTQVGAANWRRELSKNDDFFTSVPNKGHVNNKLISTTRPSSRDWWGTHTNIGVTNIRTISGTDSYMMIDYYNNYWEGIITENMTMSDNPIIGGNLTVASGVTLTIEDGTDITFENGSSLIVDGTLNVNGTSSNKVTLDFIAKNSNGIKVGSGGTATITNAIIENAYSGVQIDGSSASATINYCTIEHCTIGVKFTNNATGTVSNTISKNNSYGVYTSYSNPVIQNCTITNNIYGLRLFYSYSTPTWSTTHISNNNIASNSAYGIYVYNSSPTLSNNTLSNNGRGMVLYYSSDPIIETTSFDNSTYYGLACNGSASPNLNYNSTYGFGGYNIITENGNRGIIVTGTSFPDLGAFTPGYNSIYNNTGYEVYNVSSHPVHATYNWWGSSYGLGSSTLYGTVYYLPYLNYDPNDQQDQKALSSNSLQKAVQNSPMELPKDLQLAFAEQNTENYKSSADKFKAYFTNSKNTKFTELASVQYVKSLKGYVKVQVKTDFS